MSDETVGADTPVEAATAAKAEADAKNANLAAALLLKQLGYNVDDGGVFYFMALAKFLQSASVEERKLAETPEGLLLVLHRHLDAKKNAEAEKNPPNLKLVFGIAAAGLALLWLTSREK